MLEKMIDKMHLMKNALNTSIRKMRNGTDYKRWENIQCLSPSWDSRTKKMAEMIDDGSSVIEFGAGRLVLKDYLSKDCAYTPSDLIDRGADTIICDLNDSTLPQLQSYDVAVFSGVLEYVNNVPKLITHLSKFVNTIITSYAITDLNKKNRRAQGWMNDFSSKEFTKIFESAGFYCDQTEEWDSQLIYKFAKKKSDRAL